MKLLLDTAQSFDIDTAGYVMDRMPGRTEIDVGDERNIEWDDHHKSLAERGEGLDQRGIQ